MIYFTSDLHLGSRNIIGYEHRPYSSVEEMDAALITNWNQVVQPDDEVYVLGDFSFKRATQTIEYLTCLKGRVHLLRGNHDQYYDQFSFRAWERIDPQARHLSLDGWYQHLLTPEAELILCHFPILYWDGMDDRRSIHLYGHMHSRPNMQHPHHNTYNVGVDVNGYRPVSLTQILERIKHENL